MKTKKVSGPLAYHHAFRVITVGTGAPHYDPERASACTVVQFQDTSIVVDLGYRSVSRMLDAGLNAFQISNVMFTHCLHLDHTLDYGYFMCMSNDNDQTLNLFGPPGTAHLHNTIYELYKEQLSHGAQNGRNVCIHEIGSNEVFQVKNILVRTKEVPHIVQDIAYRFEAGGHRVIVPGDMKFDEEFISFAENADLIVFDANTAPSAFMDEMANKMRERGVDFSDERKPGGMAHATLEEIGDMAERAHAKAIVLTHFTRGPKIEEAVRRISNIYHGEIIVGEDMLAVEL